MYLLYNSYIKIATTKKEGTSLLQPVPPKEYSKLFRSALRKFNNLPYRNEIFIFNPIKSYQRIHSSTILLSDFSEGIPLYHCPIFSTVIIKNYLL